MDKIETIKKKKADVIESMRKMLDSAEAESRSLTDDEVKSYDALEASIDGIDAEITREERLRDREEEAKKVSKTIRLSNVRVKPEDPDEFKTLGEFIYAVRFNQNDRRLQDRYEGRQQSMGVGVEGGFAVPNQFREGLLQVTPQQAIFRPRATVIPAGSPPDSSVTMAALNQTQAQNMYGGVTVTWISEGATKPETDLELLEVCLTPHEVAAHVIVTDKLLRNWEAANSVITNQLRLAMIAAEETAFLSGNGAGRPLGIINSPARINYARAGANAIAYADVVGMYALLRMTMNPIWITSQTCIPQLCTMVDNAVGSNSIWVQSAVPGLPPTLMGIPVLFHERSPALGNIGDLILADLSYYLIKDGSGPFIEASQHVHFTTNRTVIRCSWNVDGQPWLSLPIQLEGAAGNFVSPFVVLN